VSILSPVSTGVGGEIDMLYGVKTVYNVQEICGGFEGGRYGN